jgi:hypothetical protein
MSLLGLVELGELCEKPLEREQSLQAVGLWFDLAGAPARDGLRGGVEHLGDLARLDPAAVADRVKTTGYSTGHVLLLA